jgi:hypothetical protein
VRSRAGCTTCSLVIRHVHLQLHSFPPAAPGHTDHRRRGADQSLTPDMVRDEYAPTRAPSLLEALAVVDNPLHTLRRLHAHLSALTDELRTRVAARRAAREEELQLYHGPYSQADRR